MSTIHLETAFQLAKGEYDEPTLRLEFGAAHMMQDVLIRMFGHDEPVYEGYTAQKIHNSLIQLVSRQHLSSNFKEGIRMAYEAAIGELIADDQFLGDIKYWDSLTTKQRSAACEITIKVLDEFIKRYAFMDFDELPRIDLRNQHFELPYIDKDGSRRVWHPTVASLTHYDRNGQHDIIVNAHKETSFNDPYHVIPSVIGECISLIISDMQHIGSNPHPTHSIYQHDLQLLKVMEEEKALIMPYLDAVRAQQFSTRFINEIKTAAAQSLSHAVEHESGHIQEPPAPATLGSRIKSAFGVLGL